jgi:hypothetical protein
MAGMRKRIFPGRGMAWPIRAARALFEFGTGFSPPETGAPKATSKDNEMVCIGPGIVPGVIDKPSIDIASVLLASVKRDVDTAGLAVLAVFGDENKAGIAEA